MISVKRSLKQTVSFLLVILLFWSLFTFPTVVSDAEVVDSVEQAENTEKKQKPLVDPSEVPELIDYSVAEEKQYVLRAYSKERTLNEVVFLRADGAYDTYIFSFPVKYEKDGAVYDKKPELVQRESLYKGTYRFETTSANDSAFYCAETARDGVLYSADQLQISLRPISVGEYNLFRGFMAGENVLLQAERGVSTFVSVGQSGTAQSALTLAEKEVAAAVYPLSTTSATVSLAAQPLDTLAFTPSYTGFKMDLNLTSAGTQTQFFFELSTNGLNLSRQEDTLVLSDDQGNPVGIVSDLLPEGSTRSVDYSFEEISDGNYLLSATVDRSSRSSTLSMTVTAYYDYLLDATVYSDDDTAYPTSRNLWVGYLDSVGQERVLIRPNNWYFKNTDYPDMVVQHAALVIRDVTVTTPEAQINCHRFTGNDWFENSNAKWSVVNGASYGTLYDYNAVSSEIGYDNGYYYSFQITSLVAGWYDRTISPTKGIMIRWDDDNDASPEEMEKCFASTQYPTEAYRPRLEITTASENVIADGVYFIRSAKGGYLTATPSALDNSNVYQKTNKLSTDPAEAMNQLWKVKHLGNGTYSIRPYHYTPAGLTNNNLNAETSHIGYNDFMEDVDFASLWQIAGAPDSDNEYGTYFYVNSFCQDGFALENYTYATDGGNISVGDNYGGDEHKWIFEQVQNPPQDFRLYDMRTGEELSDDAVRYMEVSSEYHLADIAIRGSLSTPNSIIPLYSFSVTNNGVLAHGIDDILNTFAEGSADVVCSCNLGSGYTVSRSFTAVVQQKHSGTFSIQNAKSEKYVDIQSRIPSDGAIIQQRSVTHAFDTQFWNFELDVTSGYYTISSISGLTPYYLTVQNGSSANGTAIVLQSGAVTDSMLWRIESGLSSSKTRIFPKVGDSAGRAMAIPSNSADPTAEGLQICSFTYTGGGYDEWIVGGTHIYIEFSFDQGYIERYREGNLTDEQVSAFLSDRILNDYFAPVAEAFREDCGVYFICTQDEIPSYYSDADLCQNSNIDSPCECIYDDDCTLDYYHDPLLNNSSVGFEHSAHCKNMTRLRNALAPGLPQKTVRVAFTGHTTCEGFLNGEDKWDHVLGLAAYLDAPATIIMTEFDRFPVDQVIGTLAHELTHLFDIIHHERDSDQPCVMGIINPVVNPSNENQSVSSYGINWCSECREQINNVKDLVGMGGF